MYRMFRCPVFFKPSGVGTHLTCHQNDWTYYSSVCTATLSFWWGENPVAFTEKKQEHMNRTDAGSRQKILTASLFQIDILLKRTKLTRQSSET